MKCERLRNGEVYFVEWLCLEHGEEVHQKVHGVLSTSSSESNTRTRREAVEEEFNKESKQGLRFAADAARITDEKASSEDRKHTSGGVLFLQLTIIWEQLLTRKKEHSCRF